MATNVLLPQWGMNMEDGLLVKWLVAEGDTVEAATSNELFQDYAGAEELLGAVRQIAQEQADLPKGLLLCQFKRTSPDFVDPLVCPGDSFQPLPGVSAEQRHRRRGGSGWAAARPTALRPAELVGH